MSVPASEAPTPEDTTRALTAAVMNEPHVRAHIAKMEELARCRKDPDKAVRENCRVQIDFLRIGVPEGLTAAFTYTPVAPLTVGVSAGGTGATVAVSAEATFNILWKSNFTPVITARFTNIVFTGLTDSIANEAVKNIYGDQIAVKMSGKWMHAASLLGGVDWVTDSGLHLFGKAGIVGQLGSTHGGDNSKGEIVLKGWWGPAAEIGIGGNFSWF